VNENGTLVIRGDTESGDYSTFIVHEEKNTNDGKIKYFAKEETRISKDSVKKGKTETKVFKSLVVDGL
jgi:hypothetical protein